MATPETNEQEVNDKALDNKSTGNKEDKKAQEDQWEKVLEAKKKEWQEEQDKKMSETVSAIKSQLRSDIESTKEENKKKEQELMEFKEKFTSLFSEKSHTEEELKSFKEKEKEYEELLKRAESRTNELVTGVTKKFEEELTKRDLEVYKSKLISSANGEVIPELISGNSKEEIEESFKNSQKRFKDLLKSVKSQEENSRIQNSVEPTTTNAGTNIPNNTPDARSIYNMSDEEFKEYSDSLLKKYKS